MARTRNAQEVATLETVSELSFDARQKHFLEELQELMNKYKIVVGAVAQSRQLGQVVQVEAQVTLVDAVQQQNQMKE